MKSRLFFLVLASGQVTVRVLVIPFLQPMAFDIILQSLLSVRLIAVIIAVF